MSWKRRMGHRQWCRVTSWWTLCPSHSWRRTPSLSAMTIWSRYTPYTLNTFIVIQSEVVTLHYKWKACKVNTPAQNRPCNTSQVVNLQGKLKSSKRQASELHFDFSISCIVCLTDRWEEATLISFEIIHTRCSVLAFHRQGMQGRSFKNNEVIKILNRSLISWVREKILFCVFLLSWARGKHFLNNFKRNVFGFLYTDLIPGDTRNLW